MSGKKPPPLNFVRSFEGAARHLSFTRAAEELGLTQAAVSMHIRALEQHLRVDLFLRRPRSLKLTEAGEAYLPTLRQALLMIDAATQTVRITRDYQTVTISAPMSFAENWLSARLAQFNADHPEIELIVNGTLWADADDPDTNIIIYMRRTADAPQDARLLMRENLALLASPALAQRLSDPSDVMQSPKIVIAGRQEYWTDFAQALGLPGLEMTGAVRTNASNIALEMAAHGAGVTVLPIAIAQTYLDRGLLAEPFDLRPPNSWGYYIRPSETHFLAASQKLMTWLMRRGAG